MDHIGLRPAAFDLERSLEQSHTFESIMHSHNLLLKSAVYTVCLAGMLFYVTTIINDYLKYDVQSTINRSLDEEIPLTTLCATERKHINCSAEKSIPWLRFTKNLKFLDGSNSSDNCVWFNATVNRAILRIECRITFPMRFYLTDRPPAGNKPVTVAEMESSLHVTPRRYIVRRLPLPFRTKCRDFGNGDQFDCVDRCNDTLVTCLKQCHHLPCYQETYVGDKPISISSFPTTFSVRSSEVDTVTHAAKFELDTLLIYLANLVNTFFGVSFCNGHSVIFWIIRHVRSAVSSKSVRVATKVTIQLLSLAFCIWQMVLLSIDYFSHATVSELYEGKVYPAIAVIPDITFCLNDDGQLINGTVTTSKGELLATNFNASIILKAVTVETSDREKTFTAEVLERRNWITKYAVVIPNISAHSCITVRLSSTGAIYSTDYRGMRMAIVTLNETVVKRLRLNSNAFRNWRYAIHASGKRVEPEVLPDQLERVKMSTPVAEVEVKYTKLLPPPFATRCRSYLSDSREVLHKRCVMKRSKIRLHVGRREHPFDYYTSYNKALNKDFETIAKCEQQIAPPCEKVELRVSQRRSELEPENAMYITFSDKMQRFVVEPKLVLSTYLIMVGMIVGFWLDASVWSICKFMLDKVSGKIPQVAKLSRNYIKKLVVALICASLALTVCNELRTYFSYTMITDTEVQYASMVQLPAVSVSFTTPSTKRELLSSFIGLRRHFSYRYPIVASNYTHQMDQFVKSDLQYLKEVDVFRIQITQLVDVNAARFRSERNGAVFEVYCNRLIPQKGQTVFPNYVFIWIHQPNTLPRKLGHDHNAKCTRNGSYYAALKVIFDERKTKLLPPPFASRCRQYPESQQACFENCVQNATLKKTERYVKFFIRTNEQKQTTSEIDKAAIAPCKKKCSQPDCAFSEYVAGLAQLRQPWLVLAVGPNRFEYSTTYVAKYPASELFLNLCGLVAMWTGLAVVSMHELVMHVATVSFRWWRAAPPTGEPPPATFTSANINLEMQAKPSCITRLRKSQHELPKITSNSASPVCKRRANSWPIVKHDTQITRSYSSAHYVI